MYGVRGLEHSESMEDVAGSCVRVVECQSLFWRLLALPWQACLLKACSM